jgi:hypothetical protein
MRNLQTNEQNAIQMAGVPVEVRDEIEARLQEYIAYRLEAGPRSIRFLEHLKTEGARS